MSYTIPVNSRLYKPCLRKSRTLQLPIVYRDEYNINYKKIIKKLNLNEYVRLASPNLPTNEDLQVVHSLDYLRKIRFRDQTLKMIKYQTAGSILAGKLAIYNGWSINIGGGFHNSTEKYMPCEIPFDKIITDNYADITLLVYYLFASFPDLVSRVMIIDLDACPGYGITCDFIDNQDVFILDVYNSSYFPKLESNKDWIKNVEIITKEQEEEREEEYLKTVKENLEISLNKFCPDFVVYVAGMNILKNKTCGGLSISKEGLFRRDEIVFEKVKRDRNIPIATLMGHNYGDSYNEAFAESIINLRDKNFLNVISLTQSHLSYYINCCLDEIASFMSCTDLNNLCASETIKEAREHWIPSDFYFPDDNNMNKEISSLVLSNQANFERKTTPWEINDWSHKELKKIKVNMEDINFVCLSESSIDITNIELIASIMYDNIPLYIEILSEYNSKLSFSSPLLCKGTIIISRNSRYFIQNLNHKLGEYCKNEIKISILSKEGEERRRKMKRITKKIKHY